MCLICRIYFADIAIAIVNAGKIIEPKSAFPPETDTSPSCTPNMLKNTSPNQKLGTDIPMNVIILIK